MGLLTCRMLTTWDTNTWSAKKARRGTAARARGVSGPKHAEDLYSRQPSSGPGFGHRIFGLSAKGCYAQRRGVNRAPFGQSRQGPDLKPGVARAKELEAWCYVFFVVFFIIIMIIIISIIVILLGFFVTCSKSRTSPHQSTNNRSKVLAKALLTSSELNLHCEVIVDGGHDA